MGIVMAHPDLGVDVAFHPNAYPGLLDWMAEHGRPAVQDAVRRRRASAGDGPVPPPAGAGPSAAPPGEAPTRLDELAPAAFPPSGPVGGAARPLVPGPAAAPAPRPKRRSALVGAVVGVAVVLVAGGVVFAFRDKLFGGGSDGPDSPPVGGDLVVENPPTLTSSFADGLSELWRFYGDASVQVVDPSVVILALQERDGETDALTGLDPDTGEALWTSGRSASWANRLCDPSLWQGHAVCWTSSYDDHLLIDAATGRQGETTWLKDWPIKDMFVSEGSLYVAQEDEVGRGTEGWSSYAYELTRYDSPGQARWTTSFTLDSSLFSGDSSAQVGDLVVVGLSTGNQVFDAHDGRLVAGGEECPSPQVFGGNHVTCEADADDLPNGTVPLSNGATMTKTSVQGRGSPVEFDGSDRPSAVIVWDGGDLARLDPVTGEEMWHSDLDWGLAHIGAVAFGHGQPWDDGGLLVVSNQRPRALVDLGTGNFEWNNAEADDIGVFVTFPRPEVTVLGDGFLWVVAGGVPVDGPYSTSAGAVVSLGTGDALVETEYGPGRGSDGLFVAQRLSGDHVARLAPSRSVAAPPEGLPDCPEGLSPVAWTRYADGHVVVCGSSGGGFWAAALHDGKPLNLAKLTFTDDGWTVESDGGATVAVTLEGGVVEVTGRSPGTYGAFGALLGHPVVDLSGAGEFRSCPAGARLLSLSTFDDGWLMVCGTAADAPDFAAWGGAEAGETIDVVVESGGYCADGSGVEACAYAAPARVEFTASGSDPVEHPVSDNWFDGVGHGGR
jgi:hypothetical protein